MDIFFKTILLCLVVKECIVVAAQHCPVRMDQITSLENSLTLMRKYYDFNLNNFPKDLYKSSSTPTTISSQSREFGCDQILIKTTLKSIQTEVNILSDAMDRIKMWSNQTRVQLNVFPRVDCRDGAVCVPMLRCTTLKDVLQRGRNVQLLNQLQCGQIGANPMVCCPPDLSKTVSDINANNDEVLLHPSNLNLLPDTSVCGIQYADRIVGGSKTEIDEHPWTVLIAHLEDGNSSFHCEGALISSRYVLTAAHCVSREVLPPRWTISQVRLGEWNISSKVDCNAGDCAPAPVDVNIEEVTIHERYNIRMKANDDIALLRLAREVTFSDFIKPICLPISADLLRNTFQGQDLEVAGWGLTKQDGRRSDVKLKVRLPVVDLNVCREIFKNSKVKITPNILCAGGVEGKDTCKGDSGAPLMGEMPTLQNWMVVGIVSAGIKCGTKGEPGLYTAVTKYISWILNNMRP